MPCSKMEFCFLSSQTSAGPVPMTAPVGAASAPTAAANLPRINRWNDPTSALLQNSEFSEGPNFFVADSSRQHPSII